METLQNILQAEIIQRLGWTLLHFVWQGAAIGLILAIILKLLQKSSANLRYIVACMALALIVLMPIVTIRMVDVSVKTIEPVKQAGVDLLKAENTTEAVIAKPQAKLPPLQVSAAPMTPLKDRFIEAVEPALPYLVVSWLVGVFGLSLWHLGGWTQLQRLRRQMVTQVSERIHLRLKRLSGLMGVKRAVGIMESAMVQVPTVVGHIKPLILLPASALTGLSGEQIEAILAHELAHIKRCDYLVNMLQTAIEILGFYHPALWWISHKIRIERENCCDDLAVSLCSDRISYAKALTTMEEIRGLNLAVAVSGGSLFDRIRRLLGKDSTNEAKLSWLPSVIAILLITSFLIPISFAMNNQSKTNIETVKEKSREFNQINIIHGIVRDQSGNLVSGALVLPMPYGGHPVKTGQDGKFEIPGPSEDRVIKSVFVRDINNNLAAAVELSDANKPLDITITPGITLTGRITDPQGKPISAAKVFPAVYSGVEWYAGFGYTVFKPADSNGVYEIKALPVGQDYSIEVGGGKGYGRNSVRLGLLDLPGQREINDIVLEPANLSVSGVVLDENLEPMPNVFVEASGEHQPFRKIKTDSKGRFKIDGTCKGRVSLMAWTSDKVWESDEDEANGGDSDVEIYMTKNTGPKACLLPPKSPPVSLVGKAMPSLDTLGIHLSENDIKDKRILVCFWKLMHDESRDYIRQLAARTDELEKKNIVIVAAQIWPRNEKQFRRWLEKNNVKFSVSILPDPWKQSPEQRPTVRWGMQNRVPWLILTDNEHVVCAEGFSIDDLDAKIHLSEKATVQTGAQACENVTATQILTTAYFLVVPADLPQLKEIIASDKSKSLMITPEKLEEFLDIIKANPEARYVTAPTVTTRDGDSATIKIPDNEDFEYTTLKVKNTVQPDKKTIRLELDFECRVNEGQDTSSSSVSTTAAILSNHAIALTGGISKNRLILLLVKPEILEKPSSKTGIVQTESPTGQIDGFKRQLEEPVTVHIDKNPDGDRLTIQYAVIAICKAAGVPYNWDKSAEQAESERRQYIEPVDIKNVSAGEAIHKILNSTELTYDLDENGLYLDKRKSQVLIDCYICQVSDKRLDEETVVQIKSLLGENDTPSELKSGGLFLNGKILQDITNNGISGKQFNILLEFLSSRGYLNLKVRPKMLTMDAETGTIDRPNGETFISGYSESNESGGEPLPKYDTLKTIDMKLLPKLDKDKKNIMLDVDLIYSPLIRFEEQIYKENYSYKVPLLDIMNVKTHLLIPNGQIRIAAGSSGGTLIFFKAEKLEPGKPLIDD